MFKYVLAIPLILHGLANLAGVIAAWTSSKAGFQDAAWLFGGGVTYHGQAGKASSVLWLISTLFLCAGGIGVLIGQSWWTTLALIGAAASLIVILLWWKAVPPGARFGAFFDAVLLVALLSPLKERIIETLGS